MAADNEAKKWRRDVFVPGRWVEKDIKYMEIDVPYVVLIDPDKEGEGSGHGSDYRLWVDEHGRPMLSGNSTMPDSGRDFDSSDLVGAHFGVMRTFEQLTGELREGYIVDLRYANPGDVPQIDTSVIPDSQEDLNSWQEFLSAAIPVAAVVVSKHEGVVMDPELKREKSKGKIKEKEDDDSVERDYDMSGSAAFYPALEYLMAALDKEIVRAQKQARKNAKKAKALKKLEEQSKPEQAEEALAGPGKIEKKLGESGAALVKAEE